MKTSAEADFRDFVAARWPRMLRTAHLLTGHHHDAEDLVQAALAKAYVKWDRVRRAEDPDSYVWRIMINTHRDRLRRVRLREWLTTRIPESAAPDRADAVTERGAVLDALAQLTPRQRTVVVLRYLEDRSESEVAALLGTGVGTVRTHVARALGKLREHPGIAPARAATVGAGRSARAVRTGGRTR
ncbi:SigE family RNA polymerase sigma factor [Streptomyces sp. NPDC005805]|uniref:SigE family RNA polymerase sigma factor n=1 Tax=Streptomyces sp. NPDC005805 TaxID=3157068 RepID=UPI0033D9FB56